MTGLQDTVAVVLDHRRVAVPGVAINSTSFSSHPLCPASSPFICKKSLAVAARRGPSRMAYRSQLFINSLCFVWHRQQLWLFSRLLPSRLPVQLFFVRHRFHCVI